MYSKIKTFFLVGCLASGLLAVPVAAQYGLDVVGTKAGYDTKETVFSINVKVVNGALAVLGIIFLAVMLYAGVRWMTARGKDEYVDKAKDAVSAAVMGIFLVLLAYALTNFIFVKLLNGGGSTTSEELPSGGQQDVAAVCVCGDKTCLDDIADEVACASSCASKQDALMYSIQYKDCSTYLADVKANTP